MFQENRGVEFELTDEGSVRLRCLNHGDLATGTKGRLDSSFRLGATACQQSVPTLAQIPQVEGSMSRRGNCWDNGVVEFLWFAEAE